MVSKNPSVLLESAILLYEHRQYTYSSMSRCGFGSFGYVLFQAEIHQIAMEVLTLDSDIKQQAEKIAEENVRNLRS